MKLALIILSHLKFKSVLGDDRQLSSKADFDKRKDSSLEIGNDFCITDAKTA